jgi:DNA-binding transcriptional regulator YiaG
MNKKYKTEALAAIHETMEALHDVGAVSKQTLRGLMRLASRRLSHSTQRTAKNKKACYRLNSRLFNVYMGWLMGLEPTTTGITILDSTN